MYQDIKLVKPNSKDKLAKQFEAIISEDISLVNRRAIELFGKETEIFGDSFVLFGAGSLGRKTLLNCRKVNIEPIAFCDNNKNLWGEYIHGLKVLSPWEAADNYGSSATFVITVWNPYHSFVSTKQQLNVLGCLSIISFVSLFFKYSAMFLPYYCLDLPHNICNQYDNIRKSFNLWEDDESRLEYINQLSFRMSGNFENLFEPCAGEQYFLKDLFALSDNEVFVDCGAFNGDTISMFLKNQENYFKKIIAYEPDPTNYENLQQYISQLDKNLSSKIECFNSAVGANDESVNFEPMGTEASSVGNGSLKINGVSLDTALKNKNPTFIKMDIEGYEINALMGARKTIGLMKPILAISVYHKQSHLWEIPFLIDSFYHNYHFFLRSHYYDGWDLVCYAVPNDRLIFHES